MIGGPLYSPGRRGQIRFKPFKKFEVFQKLSIFFQILIDPNLTFLSSKKLEENTVLKNSKR
jgi:hypothetical protein